MLGSIRSRALVLGASGFIGGAVARAVVERDVPTTLVVRDRARSAPLLSDVAAHAEIVEQDLGMREGVLRLIRDTQPSVIFNLAGYGIRPGQSDAGSAVLINTRLVEWLIEAMTMAAAKGSAPRLVHAGSAAELGTNIDRIDERTPERPISVYGSSKLAATRLITAASRRGLPVTCARLFMVYGPGEPPHRLAPSLLSAARSGSTLELTSGTQRRDFTYVGDVAQALLRLAAIPGLREPVINVATGTTMSVKDFATLAANVFGLPHEKLAFGARDADPGIDYGLVDISLLRRVAGWTPSTDVEHGLRQTASAARVAQT
jgi:UDP-glucose 4-epimerase